MCDRTIINRTWMYHDTHGYGWNLAKDLAEKEVLAEREAKRAKIAAKYPPRTSLPRRAKVVALEKIKDIAYDLNERRARWDWEYRPHVPITERLLMWKALLKSIQEEKGISYLEAMRVARNMKDKRDPAYMRAMCMYKD